MPIFHDAIIYTFELPSFASTLDDLKNMTGNLIDRILAAESSGNYQEYDAIVKVLSRIGINLDVYTNEWFNEVLDDDYWAWYHKEADDTAVLEDNIIVLEFLSKRYEFHIQVFDKWDIDISSMKLRKE